MVSKKSTAYRCICPPSFGGIHCDQPTGELVGKNSSSKCKHAEVLLAMLTKPPQTPPPVCYHGTSCIDGPAGPVCICPFGWRGGRCEQDVDECRLASAIYAAATANNGGINAYILNSDILSSFGDPLCNPYGSPRGFCKNLPGSYQCNCGLGYTGRNCHIRVCLQYFRIYLMNFPYIHYFNSNLVLVR